MKMLTSRRVLTASCTAWLMVLAVGCGGSSTPASKPPASTSAPGAAASASGPAVTAPAPLRTQSTRIGTVLTNSKGLTVYWPDWASSSSWSCTGACAAAWPPVTGMPQAASGVKLAGTLGTVMRADGTVQATINGHPLFTFKGDTAPGQTKGNGVSAFGARWSVVNVRSGGAVSVSPSPAPTVSSSSGSYGGGY